MLLRPPYIQQEDVKSQSSNPISHMQRQHSVKSSSKNKKKQNSLGMKKTNAVAMQYEANNMLNTQNNHDSDTGSVHSVNSRKSKSKTKQSTLAIGKKDSSFLNTNQNSSYSINKQNDKQDYQIFKLDSDDDNRSVGSHASRNSKKNTVKENSLGRNNQKNRVNVQLNYYYDNNNTNGNNHTQRQERQERQDDNTPPKTYYLQEQSKVQTVKLNQHPQSITHPLIKYNQALKTNAVGSVKNPEHRARRTQQPRPKQALSPFQEITLKRQFNEDEPVYKLKEPQPNTRNQHQTNSFNPRPTETKPSPNPFIQKNTFNNQQKPDVQPEPTSKYPHKVDLQQSSTIQPQMISTKSVTKSRRNKIFDDNNNSIANSSNINTSRTNMDGSFQRSRSKSKSKLGDLLKQTRDKKEELAKSKQYENVSKPTKVLSPLYNKDNFFTNNNTNNNIKPYTQPHPKDSYQSTNNLITIEKPNLISVSTLHEQSRTGGQRLGQNPVKMEQIRPKNIQNQVFDLGQSRQSHLELNLSMSNRHPELSNLKGDSVHFNFEPQKKKGLSITSKEKPSSQSNKSLESKKHLDRLMKKCQENQEFLAKSILSNNSELRTSQKPTLSNVPSPQINKRQQTLNRPFEKTKEIKIEQEQPGWYNMVKDEPAFQIKQVQRKQIKRPSQEEIRLERKPQYQQKSRPQQTEQPPLQQSTAKGPQQLFMNPFSRPMQQQSFSQQAPSVRQENFYKEQINQNVAVEQKNRILVNIQKKSRLQKQRQKQISYKQNPKPIVPDTSRQEDMRQRGDQRQRGRERNLPVTIQQQPQYARQEKVQLSTISHELSLSQNGSERSNSQKKNKKKESSLNIMKKHKVQVRDQSPRAEESFYEEHPKSPKYNQDNEQPRAYNQQPQVDKKSLEQQKSFKMQSSRTKVQYKKPNLINFGQSDTEQQKIKSRTDVNFYNFGEMSQKSMRPPSSKPPLSRKSGSSKSKSKAKESTLNINMTKKENKMVVKSGDNRQNNNSSKPQQKKKRTLLDIAQDKSYEGSGYGGSDSQCSFNSRQSFGSVNSRNSRKSSTSKKESTLPITIKNKATTHNNFHPSLNKISSTASDVHIYTSQSDNQSIYNQLPQQSVKKHTSRERDRERQKLLEQMQQRTIVSKDTYFIDERGRLVKQDLVIQGNKVYGRGENKTAEQMAMDRMRRSRQHHRSRSKSREGSRSRISKKNSSSFGNDSQCDSRASSSNYFNATQSNYNSYQKQNLYIQQFLKPVQQPTPNNKNPNFQKPSNQRKIEREFYQNEQQPYQNYQQQNYYNNREQQEEYDQEPVKNITLNQLFGRNKKPTQETNYNPKNTNNNYYQTSNNPYTTHKNRNQISKYPNANSKFNGQESSQSNRKKSLSRTEKNFHNR